MDLKNIKGVRPEDLLPVVVHQSMMTQTGIFDYPWNQVTFLNMDPSVGSSVIINQVPLPGGAPTGQGFQRIYSLNTREINTTKFTIDFTNSPKPQLYIVWTEYANQ